ncbi:unannotated protein [freshwater metagenome]|uniref:Unannotated protein n=1 Tax=freshwater metagenome TaxID=449393 RepID=A0A6J7HQS4_9ZZZZ
MVGGDGDARVLGSEFGPVHRLVDDGVHVDHFQVGQFLGPLQTRQRDQLGHHVAQAFGFGDDLAAEVPDGIGIVGGFEQRLGQQAHRTDRRLEFVTDVGHEVATRGLHPYLLGIVVGEENDEPSVLFAEQSRDAPNGDLVAAGPGGLGTEIDFDGIAVGQHFRRRGPRPLVDGTVTHQTELLGPRIRQHHVVKLIDDGDTALRRQHDQVQYLRHRQSGGGAAALRVSSVEVRDQNTADEVSHEGRGNCQ